MTEAPINAPLADVLAIAAHRDDVEQTCGGTLLRLAELAAAGAIAATGIVHAVGSPSCVRFLPA